MRQILIYDKAIFRNKIYECVRTFFGSMDFTEVDTPLLVNSPGMEPNLDPIACSNERALITSPEYAMKKLLGRGMKKIFTITKVFRDEPVTRLHNSEFTMLEWYEQGVDYNVGMDQTEALVKKVFSAFSAQRAEQSANTAQSARTVPFDLPAEPFARHRVRDLMLKFAKVDLDTAHFDDLKNACLNFGLTIDETDTESDLFYRLFLTQVEPRLKDIGAVFVYDYPRYQAALSKLTPDGRYGQRFELYVDGVELCNGFTELTDPVEQKARFVEEAAERAKAGKKVYPVDEELINLLPFVSNPTFGNALGLERLLMLAVGAGTIQDVLLFQ